MTPIEGPLLHFTRSWKLESILRSGRLIPGRTLLGVYPIPRELEEDHRAVCFTELSVSEAGRLAQRKGMWGIAFHRNALVCSGAQPVTYLSADETVDREHENQSKIGRPTHPFWRDNPFLSPTKPNYSWEWEREWRHVGEFVFSWDEVAFLISPEGNELRLIPDGDLGHVYRDRSPDGIDYGLAWEDGGSEPFNRVMRSVVEDFRSGYVAPEDAGFSTDREDETGFWWTVPKHDEWTILEELVPPMPERVTQALLEDLQSTAIYWAKVSELDEVYADAEREYLEG